MWGSFFTINQFFKNTLQQISMQVLNFSPVLFTFYSLENLLRTLNSTFINFYPCYFPIILIGAFLYFHLTYGCFSIASNKVFSHKATSFNFSILYKIYLLVYFYCFYTIFNFVYFVFLQIRFAFYYDIFHKTSI